MEEETQTSANYASHGRPPNRIAGARRHIQTRGVSPRPAYTEYYRPMGRDDTSDVLPPLELTGLPAFLLGSADPAELPPVPSPVGEASEREARPPSPSPAQKEASSPSVARSPPERRVSAPRPASASSEIKSHSNGSATPTKSLTGCFESLALTPYRTVVFKKTGDELILATTVYSHRVAVYVPRERAVPIRKKGLSVHTESTDFVSEHSITEKEDLDKYGAGELCYAAGTAADEAEVTAYTDVFGVLASTTNPQNSKSTRYFALLCRSDSEPQESTTQDNPAETDVYIYAETEAATHEFRNRHRRALFARAQAVIPIIHLSTIEKEASESEGPVALANCIYAATRKCELRFTVDAFVCTDSLASRLERLRTVTDRLRLLAPECSLVRSKETDSALAVFSKDQTSVSEELRKHASNRVRELALYSVHLQETIGSYIEHVECAVSEAEAAAEAALASLYSDTRIAIFPDPVPRGSELAKAETWGYPPEMDALSVTDPPSGEAFLADSEFVPPQVATAMRCLIAARESD